MYIKLVKFVEGPVMRHAHNEDAGFDVYAQYTIGLKPGETKALPLGFAIDIPENFMGIIMPRTSLANLGLHVAMCPIDSGYKGEIHAILTNISNESITLPAESAIAQLVVLPICMPIFMYRGELWSNSKDRAFLPSKKEERGVGWAGSTNEDIPVDGAV